VFDRPVQGHHCLLQNRRAMRRPRLLAALLPAGLLPAALAACGTTSHFVEQPPLSVGGGQDTHQAMAALFGADPPYVITLCEADPSSKACKPDSKGISATGVGGLFIPLALRVRSLRVSQARPSAEGWAIDVSFDSRADGVAPMCATAQGAIIARADNTASIRIGNFYCNWMAVGNVLARADLSIDSIDVADRTFTGYYRLTFHGTGNVAGSGYFRATVAPTAN
jgi:hypothetical protein